MNPLSRLAKALRKSVPTPKEMPLNNAIITHVKYIKGGPL